MNDTSSLAREFLISHEVAFIPAKQAHFIDPPHWDNITGLLPRWYSEVIKEIPDVTSIRTEEPDILIISRGSIVRIFKGEFVKN
jgi:hypothetical protein